MDQTVALLQRIQEQNINLRLALEHEQSGRSERGERDRTMTLRSQNR